LTYLVRVRFFDEVHSPTEFVTPQHPDVVELARKCPTIEEQYDWVCRNVRYPSGPGQDRHRIEAFGSGLWNKPIFRQVVYEMWHTSAETLGWGRYMGQCYGDCEDTSILLVSLARAAGYNAYVGVGEMGGMGHAWCMYDGKILETTLSSSGVPRDQGPPYDMMGWFNDLECVELLPGTYGRMGELMRSGRTFRKDKEVVLGELYGKLDRWTEPIYYME